MILQYASKGEAKVVRKLVNNILAAGYSVSVWEGEDYALKRSRNKADILAALCSTGYDVLVMRDKAGDAVGQIALVWGNEDDGSCLIADHSDNQVCNDLTKFYYDL